MAKVGRLAGGMAHQFNNLHAVILNYAAFVAEALPDATAQAAPPVARRRAKTWSTSGKPLNAPWG